jgi:homoserine kinase type II
MEPVTTVFMLYHQPRDHGDGPMLLGVYSGRERAEARIEHARERPGFRDYPNDFEIAEHEIDRDWWTEGFATYTYER